MSILIGSSVSTEYDCMYGIESMCSSRGHSDCDCNAMCIVCDSPSMRSIRTCYSE